MIVEQIMQQTVYTLSPDDKIGTALQLFRDKKIRHVPIVDEKGALVGIVTDRDVKDSTPSILKKDLSEEELNKPLSLIMQRDVVTGHPLDFVEDIAAVFYEYNIGCMPIVQGGEIVGIVTETDVLHTFVELTGANQPGSRIEIKLPNKPGELFDVVSILNKRRANIHSVLVYPDKEDENSKIVVFRVRMMNPIGVIDDLKKEGHDVLWPNMPGMSS
ncbi:acetoin utilization AcuB family protein [Pseudobacillus wudalianchiensis]|uniref:Acetoin utilization protein AcuB n=1 Tax=Pseudobacillus wudalianchiensis TaxID=1743143 RepID=A0A1B9B7Z7_9BACI|nr:acetoin utilization AcuB family protein [Bacillus wudalianchiensis]OCA92225.1 acetoin utilization protein AcuB [Bacillus wudalianchiensis]